MGLSLAFMEHLGKERHGGAQEDGAVGDLPGQGQPLDLDNDARVPRRGKQTEESNDEVPPCA